MRKVYFIEALLLIAAPSFGQEADLSQELPANQDSVLVEGKVVNVQGIPIKDAVVRMMYSKEKVITEVDGYFKMTIFKSDELIIEKNEMATFHRFIEYPYKGVVILDKLNSYWMSNSDYLRLVKPAAEIYFKTGMKFMQGEEDCEPDCNKAAACFWRAANMEYAPAAYYLGKMYEEGIGLDQNYEAAILWYEKAAHSESKASTRLAQLYYEGEVIAQDYQKSAEYYYLAIDNGDSIIAKKALEDMFANGLVEKTELRRNIIYEVIEECASFPGGNDACNQWLRKNIRYPKDAFRNGIQGRVFVQFVVERDGTITHIKVLRSPDPSLSKEAIRVVNTMPQWKPARQGNKVVRSRYNLSISFNLKR